MKLNFLQKNVLIFIFFLIYFVIFIGQSEAASKGKVRPVLTKCVSKYKGKCVSESEAKGKEIITTAEKLCSKDKVCIVDKQTPGNPVNGNKITPTKTPENKPAVDGKISDFCKNNPTKAEIQAGNLKSKVNSNITYDSSVMSQEECQVWIKGTPEQYQEYVAKNDPVVNKEYKEILQDMKSKMTDPGLLTNINKTIADMDKTVASQTKKTESAMSSLLAPARDGALKKAIPIESNPVSSTINTVEEYKNACKKNNYLPNDADSISLKPKVVYSGQTRCPAGYIENGLQYSIPLGMRCCVRDDTWSNYCVGGELKYSSECYSGRSTSQYPIFIGNEMWVCCPTSATRPSNGQVTNISSTSNSNTPNSNLIQAPVQSNTVSNSNLIGMGRLKNEEYTTLCRLNYPTENVVVIPGNNCSSPDYERVGAGINGIVSFNPYLNKVCCKKLN